ncbi:MAG: AmmeMemoRadiSam system protein A [Clostridiaceae bacterium]
MGKILGFYTMPHPPIVIPEVGKGEENKIQSTFDSCSKIGEEISKLNPSTIIIITPHGTMFSDAVAITSEDKLSGSLSNFGVPQVKMDFNIDIPLTDKIASKAEQHNVPVVKLDNRVADLYNTDFKLDHGTIVPLYFINKRANNFKLVHITYGMLSDIELYKFGMAIQDAVKESDTNAVFIASGDLSHRLKEDGPYDYNADGEKFDKSIIHLLEKGDVLGVFNMNHNVIENAGECGLRSFYVMLGAMNGHNIIGELLSYEGTFGVGYGVMRFNLKENNVDTLSKILESKEKHYEDKLKNQDPYVKLARESLTTYLKSGKFIDVPDTIVEEMKNIKRGVFVSLKKSGQLRGCIGTIFPVTDSVAEEIIRNAVEAGENDPRFSPVREEELKDIDFSVDVLTEPESSTYEELDPKRYGVIVRYGRKAGLLLPDLEGVNTVDEQLDISLQKAGIRSNEKYTIERFEVIRHR